MDKDRFGVGIQPGAVPVHDGLYIQACFCQLDCLIKCVLCLKVSCRKGVRK